MGNTMQKLITVIAAIAIAWPAFALTGTAGSMVVRVVAGDTTDTDGDVLLNVVENTVRTDISLVDTDGDAMDDEFEVTNNLNPLDASDAPLDMDSDGLTNLEEYGHGTDPFARDTDGDGFADNLEVLRGTDAGSADAFPVSNIEGDVDADGVVNATDIQNVINAALGLPTDAPADVDHVNSVNSVDIQLVINAALAG